MELRLLQKLFGPEEATLAAAMSRTPTPLSEISAHTGVDPDAAALLAMGMADRGLIRVQEREGEFYCGLNPFIVGFYESHLPRMDVEFAEMFEQYYQETQGLQDVLRAPSVHRVIPVEEAVPVDMEIFPYERASELVEGAKSWGVRDCICRVRRGLIGKDCGHPVEVCLGFAPVEGAFDNSAVSRALSKIEALDILRQSREAGLVHTTGNYRDGNSYICNCCTCSCEILRSVAEFGHLTSVAHSDFRSSVDAAVCIGCAECVQSCQFGALSVPEDVCVVDHDRCQGCGLCITVCVTDALRLERRPQEESSQPPESHREWEMQRDQGGAVSLAV